jgi:hypothetical protein
MKIKPVRLQKAIDWDRCEDCCPGSQTLTDALFMYVTNPLEGDFDGCISIVYTSATPRIEIKCQL